MNILLKTNLSQDFHVNDKYEISIQFIYFIESNLGKCTFKTTLISTTRYGVDKKQKNQKGSA